MWEREVENSTLLSGNYVVWIGVLDDSLVLQKRKHAAVEVSPQTGPS